MRTDGHDETHLPNRGGSLQMLVFTVGRAAGSWVIKLRGFLQSDGEYEVISNCSHTYTLSRTFPFISFHFIRYN